MARKFEHFILTRFNIRWNKDADPPDIKWLNHRFSLFDKHCFPSVKNQINQNFKWLVFFDSSTPKKYQETIRKYSEWRNFISCFINNSNLDFKDRINSIVNADIRYIITTRLDNDDGIAKEFIDTIQQQFRRQEFEFINIVNGYVYSKKKLYKRSHKSNSFISLIEKRKNFKTVWCKQHGKVSSVGKVEQVESKPLWFQVFHDKNFRARSIDRKLRRVSLRKLKGNFIFDVNEDFYDKENTLYIILENFMRFWMDIIFRFKRYIIKLFS